MSRLISQVLIICFQPRYGFGVSPACPDKRRLTISSLGFGFVLFLLDPSKEEHIFVCCLLAPVSFSCFSPFVSMWRHCKTGAADSPAARRGCPAPPRGTVFRRASRGLRRCPQARKGRGQSRPLDARGSGLARVRKSNTPGAAAPYLCPFSLSQETSKDVSVFKMHLF